MVGVVAYPCFIFGLHFDRVNPGDRDLNLPMRVIIAGSRSFAKFKSVSELDEMVNYVVVQSGFNITRVVSGGAVGIDQAGERWAERNGVPWKPRFRPQWCVGDMYDPTAGFKRNNKMALYGQALVEIWDGVSSGSRDMIEQMVRLDKPVCIHIPQECNDITVRLISPGPLVRYV